MRIMYYEAATKLDIGSPVTPCRGAISSSRRTETTRAMGKTIHLLFIFLLVNFWSWSVRAQG